MSELEQLKADLVALQKTRTIAVKFVDQKNITDFLNCHDRAAYAIQAKIKELEAPPDPFRRAKHLTEIQRKEKNHDFFLADYAIHLEDENERLKAELDNRPVVWCLKTSSGSLHTGGVNNTTILFHSMLDAAGYAKKHGYYWLKADIYTGKESE